jgi:hypothetical protein
MQLNYPIENLPFDIQMKILSYKPRLSKINASKMLKLIQHFEKRYCKICGEYIDYPIKNNDYTPKHLHTRNFLKYSKKYNFHIINPIPHISFQKFNKINCVSVSCYNILLYRNSNQYLKLVMRINSPLYFFNFKRMLNSNRKIKLLQFINLYCLNIFMNQHSYLIEDFEKNYKLNNVHHYNRIQTDYCIYDKLSYLFSLKSIFYNISLYNTEYIDLYINEYNYDFEILKYFLLYNPKKTINYLLNHQKTFLPVFLDIIDFDHTMIEYIPEKILKKLYNYHSRFFINIYDERNDCDDFFTLFDPIEETLYLRNY